MKYEILGTDRKQFRHCQATIYNFYTIRGTFTIFYSYTTPKIVRFPDYKEYRFEYEGSRKAWSITWSHTTSKQCNQRLGRNHKDLEPINLKQFEENYFDTRVDLYY